MGAVEPVWAVLHAVQWWADKEGQAVRGGLQPHQSEPVEALQLEQVPGTKLTEDK